MTAQIAAYGRLVADPQLKTTSKGTQMAMASMAVPLPCSQADDGTATMWLSVLAFGRQADALARHQKGELVSVAGNTQGAATVSPLWAALCGSAVRSDCRVSLYAPMWFYPAAVPPASFLTACRKCLSVFG